MTDEPNTINVVFARVAELEREGLSWSQVLARATLEERIRNWPTEYGDDLPVVIYGDFDQPAEDVALPELGITVYREKIPRFKPAMTALKARVVVKARTIAGLDDAAHRLNILLGAYTLVGWGNTASGWWSYFYHGLSGGVQAKIDHPELPKAIRSIQQIASPSVARGVNAALYWIREPNKFISEHRIEVLRRFSAYWNAFECLVEAVAEVVPQTKQTPTEKQAAIDAFMKANGRLTTWSVTEMYRTIVNPGFVGKAGHAPTVCCEDDAPRYIDECFRHADRRNRLYDIRNEINHGSVAAESLQELARIGDRLHVLFLIGWRIFGRLVDFPYPVDNDTPPHANPVGAAT